MTKAGLYQKKKHKEVITISIINNKILIVGRTGSGKDTIGKILAQNGKRGVTSYATRPKRTPYEDTHIFIQKEDVNKYKDIVAYTKIGEYEYFATQKQLNSCDYYIIDPNGVDSLLANNQNKNLKFHIIYLYASKETRLKRALGRVDKTQKEKETEIFNKRDDAENEQFTQFEKECASKYENINIINTELLTIDEMKNQVDAIMTYIDRLDKISQEEK